jgi:hypothetical protein
MTKNTISTAFVLIGSGRCGLQPENDKKLRARIKGIRVVMCNSESRYKPKNQTIL